MFSQESIIGVVGSGAMGSGIAQVSATNNYKTIVFDTSILGYPIEATDTIIVNGRWA